MGIIILDYTCKCARCFVRNLRDEFTSNLLTKGISLTNLGNVLKGIVWVIQINMTDFIIH